MQLQIMELQKQLELQKLERQKLDCIRQEKADEKLQLIMDTLLLALPAKPVPHPAGWQTHIRVFVALLALSHSLDNCGITDSQRTAHGRPTRFAPTSSPLATLEISQAGDTSSHPLANLILPIRTAFDDLAKADPTQDSDRVIRYLLGALGSPTAGLSHAEMWGTAHKSFLNLIQIPSSHTWIIKGVDQTNYGLKSYPFRTAMQSMAASLR